MNSMACATLDPKTGEYSFQGKFPSVSPVNKVNIKAIEEIFAANGLSRTTLGVGVDQGLFSLSLIKIGYIEFSLTLELLSAIPSHNPTFVS